MELFIIISSASTFGIFLFTYLSYKTYKKTEEKFNDLLQALVIATILSANSDPTQFQVFKKKFLENYSGKHSIFPS
ncbi:MAG: hypothetical protein IH949_13430 [Bacteroidetes bacterium]|nr:hypothetical protein [Bacteroidota bacterium]